MKVRELLKLIDVPYRVEGGSLNHEVDSLAPLDRAWSRTISFCVPGKEAEALKSHAGVVICDGACPDNGLSTYVRVDHPRFVWIDIAQKLFPDWESGIHSTAVIDRDVSLGENCYIGPHTYIGPLTIIENNVQIQAGAVIGEPGYGVWRHEGKLMMAPQYGAVTIEEGVRIGANTCIDRASFGETVIGRGTQVDNLVHIAHNVQIGEYCAVVSHAMIGGSVIIGKNCWIGPHSAIRNKVKIGDGVLVGMGAVVVNDVPDNTTVVGVPAKPMERER